MPSVDLIIVAAGSGLRFGAPLPKQFCELAGRPVMMHTIDSLRHTLPEANIILVISQEMEELWRELCQRHGFSSPLLTFGGATRWESVRNALKTSSADIVMIHDAVRPIVTQNMIDRLSEAMADDTTEGAIPATAVTDSLRSLAADGTSKAVNRSTMRAVQTPQAFRGSLLRQAYRLPYRDSFTDDASVMEAAGFTNLRLTEGSPNNIKITNPGDIAVAELLMKSTR